jgi:hypothetical protein
MAKIMQMISNTTGTKAKFKDPNNVGKIIIKNITCWALIEDNNIINVSGMHVNVNDNTIKLIDKDDPDFISYEE